MVQPSQHVAACVKGVEWGLGTRGLRIILFFCLADDDLFFCGDLPGTADCAIWGGLAQLRWNAPGTKYEALVTGKLNLYRFFIDRFELSSHYTR